MEIENYEEWIRDIDSDTLKDIITMYEETQTINNLSSESIERDFVNLLERVLYAQKGNAKNLSIVDRAISDLLHEVEISDSKNACEGYLIYKKLRELRQERRFYSDNLLRINEIINILKRNRCSVKQEDVVGVLIKETKKIKNVSGKEYKIKTEEIKDFLGKDVIF